jgi:hypothetical protein
VPKKPRTESAFDDLMDTVQERHDETHAQDGNDLNRGASAMANVNPTEEEHRAALIRNIEKNWGLQQRADFDALLPSNLFFNDRPETIEWELEILEGLSLYLATTSAQGTKSGVPCRITCRPVVRIQAIGKAGY